jgi:hypothetical protein
MNKMIGIDVKDFNAWKGKLIKKLKAIQKISGNEIELEVKSVKFRKLQIKTCL